MNIKLILFLACGLLLFFNCNREDDEVPIPYESTGSIIGVDFALCPCCGGYRIEIDSSETNLNFTTLPDGTDIDLVNESFPIPVKLNWSADSDAMCPNIITIGAIARD